MFVHEMTEAECHDALERTNVGRLACAHDNQPYVVPINFAFDGTYLYGFTTVGQKIEWMRLNPLVCFEMDEVFSDNQWTSVIAFGRYEELPDRPEFERARTRAHALLQKRPIWWEPAYISQEHRDQVHSLTPIFYRIHINKMTGHRATLDAGEAAFAAVQESTVNRPADQLPPVAHIQLLSILKAAIVYFALVFGTGFLFGSIRILLAVPHIGERVSELLEAPLMLIAIFFAAKWVVRRFPLPPVPIHRLGVGLLALALGLLFEFTLVLPLRGITLTEYFRTRDPVSGTVYYLTLILFALMPFFVKRKSRIIARRVLGRNN